MRGGVITRAWTFLPGEFEDDDTRAYLIGDDGELNSKWDWAGHPARWLDPEACGALRLATTLDCGGATRSSASDAVPKVGDSKLSLENADPSQLLLFDGEVLEETPPIDQ